MSTTDKGEAKSEQKQSSPFEKVKQRILDMLEDQKENFALIMGCYSGIEEIASKITNINLLLEDISSISSQFKDTEEAHSKICWIVKKYCPYLKESTQKLQNIEDIVSKVESDAKALLEDNKKALNGIGIAIVMANLVVLGNLIEHLYNKKANIKDFVDRLQDCANELDKIRTFKFNKQALALFHLMNKLELLIQEIQSYKNSLAKKSSWAFLAGALGLVYGGFASNGLKGLRVLCGVLGVVSLGASATFKMSEKEVERIYQNALALKKELVDLNEKILQYE